ncbi:MAG: hypothetical protein EOP38_17650 [Rubrivivax sp.]|nr:MAG: hypothetical protein EOP38_17650 [Rubrivivax sp.]
MSGLKKFALISGMVVAALAVASLIVLGRPGALPSMHTPVGAVITGAPWQVESLPSGGTRVFKLFTLAPSDASTLAQVQAAWSSDFQMAVIAAPGEHGTLEAYVETATLGGITGKLVATGQIQPEVLKGFRERAAKVAFMDSSTRRYTLAEADRATALQSPLLGLTFIPQAQLDDEVVKARFGEPAERLRGNDHVVHWLYPRQGLAITLDSQGKEVLQYVAPAHFARLRDPLIKPPSTEGQAAH